MRGLLFRSEYFWGLMLVFGFVYVGQLRRRLRPLIAADPSLEPGARTLVRTALVIVTTVPIVQGSLQFFGGFSWDPAWWATHDLSNPYVLGELVFQLLFTTVTLWWAWLANGPARLLKYRAALIGGGGDPFQLSPTGLKWFVTIVCFGFDAFLLLDLLGGSRK